MVFSNGFWKGALSSDEFTRFHDASVDLLTFVFPWMIVLACQVWNAISAAESFPLVTSHQASQAIE
jgi:hypothetical protein